jgi:hypothetical protein
VKLLAAFAAALALAPFAPAATTSTPRLSITDTAPVVVRGWSFRPHEQVRIVVTYARTRLARTVTASATGGFVVRFATSMTSSECGPVSAAATGSAGSRAVFKQTIDDCGPPPQPANQ